MVNVRGQILQAGLELFSEHGYVGATTREIAKRAGITEVTLFRHFASKEKLFEEVIYSNLPTPGFNDIIAKAATLEYKDALTLIAGTFLDGLRTQKGLVQIMYSETQRYGDLMERIYFSLIENLNKILATYFEGLQEDGLIRKFNPRIGASAFLGMWIALFEAECLFLTVSPEKSSSPEEINEYMDIFILGTQKSN